MPDIQSYLGLSFSTSSSQTYSSWEKKFLDWVLPAIQTDISFLFSSWWRTTFTVRCIFSQNHKAYLNEMLPAAVRHLHIQMDCEFDVTKVVLLQLVCRGVKRCQGDSPRVRLPITIIHLQLFHALLAISSTTHSDSIMIWATMTLAFFGFLRLGELTCNSKFFPEKKFTLHLRPRMCRPSANTENSHRTREKPLVPRVDDVRSFPHMGNPDFTTVYIKTSKTDPFRTGHTTTIGNLVHLFAPSWLWKHTLRQEPPPLGHFLHSPQWRPWPKQL